MQINVHISQTIFFVFYIYVDSDVVNNILKKQCVFALIVTEVHTGNLKIKKTNLINSAIKKNCFV